MITQKLSGKGLPCSEQNMVEKIRSAKKIYTFYKEKVEPLDKIDNTLSDKILKLLLFYL